MNLIRFIRPSLRRGRTLDLRGGNLQWQVTKTNLKTRQPYKEIVDGQQRTTAIWDFYRGTFKLSPTLETPGLAGKTYDEFQPEDQQTFIDYPLSVDLFVGATEYDVRETFRRMNSYTVPLNPEEHRHAVYQGRFKWSTYSIARKYTDIFAKAGTFSEKAFVRMADMKLLTEVIHAYFDGVTTTNKRMLDKIYKRFDQEYPLAEDIERQLGEAIEIFAQFEAIHKGPLVKPYMVYSLILAIWHKRFGIPALAQEVPRPRGHRISIADAERELSVLAEAVASGDEAPDAYEAFVEASVERTNVKSQRLTRVRSMLDAI